MTVKCAEWMDTKPTSAHTMLMPPFDHFQYMLPLRILTPVPHKLHRIIVCSPRGSCQGFWQVPRPVRVPVVAGNEGIAARHDAGCRSVVGGHLSPLNSGIVSLELLLHVQAQQKCTYYFLVVVFVTVFFSFFLSFSCFPPMFFHSRREQLGDLFC